MPKNGEERVVYMHESLEKLVRSITPSNEGCLFHNKNKLLTYSYINNCYARTFKKMGIFDQVSGTHTLRYTAASMIRNLAGLDAVMAVTGHKDMRMAQHYGKLDVDSKQKEAGLLLEEVMKK